jgi:hypothetical protein
MRKKKSACFARNDGWAVRLLSLEQSEWRVEIRGDLS